MKSSNNISLNENKIENIIKERIYNNFSISNKNQKIKSFVFINNNNNPFSSIIRKKSKININKSNNKNSKTGDLYKQKKELADSSINNLCKVNTIRKDNGINSYNFKKNKKSGLSCKLTKRNSPNISKDKKEFNKIIIIEPPKSNNNERKNTEENKKNTNARNNNIKKKKSNQKISFIKKRNDPLILAKTQKSTGLKNVNVDDIGKITTKKFLKAQEKWKNDYFATVIQKIFRGYFYRKKIKDNKLLKKNFSIYIKKMPKDKSLCKHNNNKKNMTLVNFRNNSRLIHTYTSTEKLKENISSLSNNNNMVIKRYNSPNKNPKIKEIIIKKKKNYPVVNLNLNNFFYPNYFYDYNNYYCNDVNKMITVINNKSNDNIEKYWQKIKLVGKLRKILLFWMNLSFKNKIIKSIIKTRKSILNNELIRDNKSDDTHSTTIY